MNKNDIRISVVLGSYNRFSFLPLAITSIRNELAQLPVSYEIIVVDGGSDDGSLAWLLAQKDIITIVQHNRGEWLGQKISRRSWGYFMNLAFKIAQGTYVCMVSDDSVFISGSLKKGYVTFDNALKNGKNVGAVAFYWRDSFKDQQYHVGIPMGRYMYVNHGMYLKQALEVVGYIDEDSGFYFADIDLCFKLWQLGYECIDATDAFVEHYPHANVEVRKSNEKKFLEDSKRLVKKWGLKLDGFSSRSLGDVRYRTFEDSYKTSEVFKRLHEEVIVQNPSLLRGPSLWRRLYGAVRWRCRAVWRKIGHTK
jgi:glycosyltransferase involved in cell wall biosynthesis